MVAFVALLFFVPIVIAVSEFILAKLSPSNPMVSIGTRFMLAIGLAWLMTLLECKSLTSFVLAGIYIRNCPFGVVHGKNCFLAHHLLSSKCNPFDFTQGKIQKLDVQALIAHAVEKGEYLVRLPKGRFIVDGCIEINYSGITLEGEIDSSGNLLTELICNKPTLSGERNPWLSPFFISTGEQLQPSNMFWGIDFKKKIDKIIQTSSMSDPGSDGKILTPEYATRITECLRKGETILHVENTETIGKHILIGMYNTTADGNLIKNILGVDKLDSNWIVAQRAGKECAPSFQWLVGVKQVIDSNTLELEQEAFQDIEMEYAPEIWNAEMLENITIRNLKINSRWNGLFHHHGFPLYYSVRQAQTMDYGWNAINMKRVANGRIENVKISNFTNPLYIMDSRNCVVSNIDICGYDGHQGLKYYSHACNNVFIDIRFHAHFADMLSGEGNAYTNSFNNISYQNSEFKPVDFDFHGFSEGPFSPPAYNIFNKVKNFRYIKGDGAMEYTPSCGQYNEWHGLIREGEKKGEDIFYSLTYRKKEGVERLVISVGYALSIMLKTHSHSITLFRTTLKSKLKAIDATGIKREDHYKFFVNNKVYTNVL
ncbi:MAG: hypothetical protein Q4A15_02560 [Prevotellaceae bacterium]|nr:hypothetical protein [Prevotellaceae bacterium]